MDVELCWITKSRAALPGWPAPQYLNLTGMIPAEAGCGEGSVVVNRCNVRTASRIRRCGIRGNLVADGGETCVVAAAVGDREDV